MVISSSSEFRRLMTLLEDVTSSSMVEAPSQDEIAKTIIDKTINTKFKIIGTWSINSGKVDVEGSVKVKGKMSRLPFSFGRVTGTFDCSRVGLTTLIGCPFFVGGLFGCISNPITSLVGAPSDVGSFLCYDHALVSLEGLPLKIAGDLCLSWSEKLPMLRLVGRECEWVKNTGFNTVSGKPWALDGAMEIVNKYKNDSSRSNILACQKELIDAGFEGNASW